MNLIHASVISGLVFISILLAYQRGHIDSLIKNSKVSNEIYDSQIKTINIYKDIVLSNEKTIKNLQETIIFYKNKVK